jgi:purine-cytosine permease-like protein
MSLGTVVQLYNMGLFSWLTRSRKYPNMLTTLVIILTAGGFGCTATVIAGQSLSYLSDGSLSEPVGMLIIVLISLVVSFFGYRILHIYERWAWIPVLVAIIFTVGCAGSDLKQPPQTTPTPPRQYLGVVAMASGSQLTWAMLVGD